MTRRMSRALAAPACALALLAASTTPALGQRNRRLADRIGLGPAGTIGRGTQILPGGPMDTWDQEEMSSGGPSSRWYPSPTYTYTRGYASVPQPSRSSAPAAPYLTNRYYEPGDGYRYPLYYNPATRSYFYYPVRR